jgi:hypothetical protein
LPWPISYLLPAVKWFPLYWPNAPWEIRDLNSPTGIGQPPDGAIIRWWKLPKDQWPIEAPWEPKIFGAWPASKVTMIEDLQRPPGVWPGRKRIPPFGFIKLAMPGELALKNHQAFMQMKMHMRPDIAYVGNHFKIRSYINAFGEQKFFYVNSNSEYKEYDMKEWRAALRGRRYKQVKKMVEELEGQPKQLRPPTNLFTNEPQREVVDLFT